MMPTAKLSPPTLQRMLRSRPTPLPPPQRVDHVCFVFPSRAGCGPEACAGALAKPPYCTCYTSGGRLNCSYDWEYCWDQIHAPSSETHVIMRCDVNFNQSSHGRNLKTMIDIPTHIEFLETCIYAEFILWYVPELF